MVIFIFWLSHTLIVESTGGLLTCSVINMERNPCFCAVMLCIWFVSFWHLVFSYPWSWLRDCVVFEIFHEREASEKRKYITILHMFCHLILFLQFLYSLFHFQMADHSESKLGFSFCNFFNHIFILLHCICTWNVYSFIHMYLTIPYCCQALYTVG